jgi:hypothetical protein
LKPRYFSIAGALEKRSMITWLTAFDDDLAAVNRLPAANPFKSEKGSDAYEGSTVGAESPCKDSSSAIGFDVLTSHPFRPILEKYIHDM